ncbi:MAG TPA: MerR family transcriptional regulator [Thermoanaerobaculia bacterium]|nr:MerR family transcriptional regulator [Thermoanaerobaculia bacterium]
MGTVDETRFKIGEVCRLAGVQPYVLRYWETEFPPLAPGKTGGGQRLYTQREIDIILRIKTLLYDEGFTIAGAKKKLEGELDATGSVPAPAPVEDAAQPAPAARARSPRKNDVIRNVERELRSILKILSRP